MTMIIYRSGHGLRDVEIHLNAFKYNQLDRCDVHFTLPVKDGDENDEKINQHMTW